MKKKIQIQSEDKSPFELDVVRIKLVKDTPLFSELPLRTPYEAVSAIGEILCDMDREVVCVRGESPVRLKSNQRDICKYRFPERSNGASEGNVKGKHFIQCSRCNAYSFPPKRKSASEQAGYHDNGPYEYGL